MYRALLLAAIVVGALLRGYALGDKLLWHDEVATRVFAAGFTTQEWKEHLYQGHVVDVSEVLEYQRYHPERDQGVLKTIAGMAKDDPQHPPLYYVLAKVWVSWVGDSISALRALSVIFGLLCIPAMAWLLRELGGSERARLIGAALMATSPFFVLYAQEAREYALWALLIVASNAALLRAIRAAEGASLGARVAAWAPYAVLSVVGLYTSFSMSAVILSQILFIVLRERGRPNATSLGAAAALAIAGLLFLPWALNLIREYEAFEISMRWSREIIIPRAALLRLLGVNTSRTFVDLWPDATDLASYAVMLAASGFVVVALVALARSGRRDATLLLFAMIFLPMGLLLVPDLVQGGIRSISTRYLSAAWVGCIAAAALYLDRSPRALAALVLGAGLVSSSLHAARPASWTKSVSLHLVEVAQHIGAAERPYVMGNLERHNPANLLALAVRLPPGTKMQFLRSTLEERFVPPRDRTVFLFTPIHEYRTAMEQREDAYSEALFVDEFMELWRVYFR